MTSEPSIGEIVRRLDDITRRQNELFTALESTYVRKDNHDLAREADRAAVREVAGDMQAVVARLDKGENFRRQILAGASVGVILLVINLVLALSNFTAMKAGG